LAVVFNDATQLTHFGTSDAAQPRDLRFFVAFL
jgi:hypothetical protein